MMAARLLRSWLTWVLIAGVAAAVTYSRFSGAKYEYEEVIALELDGSATVDVNGSVVALTALHGVDLNPDRPQRERVEALFAAPGVEVSEVTTFRRGGRRFVHVSLDVADIRRLAASAPFAGTAIRFGREGDVMVYRQQRASASESSTPVHGGAAGLWTGDETVAIRIHVPSRVLFENAPGTVERGNILVWEQSLADRLAGAPVALHVLMDTESILYSTLVLFGATIGAVAIMFVVLIGLIVRKGRMEARKSHRM